MKKTKIIALLLTLTMLFSVLPLSVLAENGEAEEQPASGETLWETGEKEETLPPEEQPEPEDTEPPELEEEPKAEEETPEPEEELKAEEETPAPEEEPKAEEETPEPEEEPKAEKEEIPAPTEEPAEEETGGAEYAEAETPPEETAEPVTDEGWEDFIEALPEPEGEDWNKDLLTLAESQIGQGVVEELTAESEDGEKLFYTRYSAWMGLPYEPWCASFVAFCLSYAGIPSEAVPRSAGCESWCLALREDELLIEAENEEGEAYIPEPGDLVFFADRPEGRPCHVGIVRDYKSAEYDEEGKLIHDDLLLTIEGNNGPTVAEFEHERSAWGEYAWVGFVSLHAAREVWEREREDEVRAHTAEVEKNLLVCPMLADENTVLWLVGVYDAPMACRQYTWDGEPMFWSDAHCAWVSCLWSFEMPTAGGLAEVPGRGETLEPDADLNGTGREDLNDVQFLYSIYRESGAAAELDRALCLRCDLDGNGVIDMADVQNLLFRISE